MSGLKQHFTFSVKCVVKFFQSDLFFVVKISGKFVNSSHVVLVDDWQCQDNRDEFSTLDLLIPASHLSHYFCDGFLTFFSEGSERRKGA